MKPNGNLFAGALASALLLGGRASTNGLSPEASPRDASDLAARKAHSAATLSPSAWPDRGLTIARPVADALREVALPSAIPAELIGRRPDIVAQCWRVEAAQKDIAGAKASLLEQRSLDADLRARDLEISIGLVRALAGGFIAPAGPLATARWSPS
jgi:outer membrane protein TolC